ncbi:MAG: DUF2339 domain-containing protein [Planctomycetota bacterium]
MRDAAALQSQLDHLAARLAAVEDHLGIGASPPVPAAPAPPQPAAEKTPAAISRPPGATRRDAMARLTSREPRHAVAPPQPQRLPKARPAREPWSLERLIGGQWFAIVGAVVIVVGVALGLKLAYDAGFFGRLPAGAKLGAASLFGALLLAAGEMIRRRVNRYASAIVSASGVGVLYAAAYAAHGVYGMVGEGLGMALLACVSGLGIGLGVLTGFASLAAVALIGAYVAPVLLSTGAPSPVFFPVYLLSLLAVALTLSLIHARRPEHRHFHHLRTLGWWGTVLLGTPWFLQTGLDVPANGLLFVAAVWCAVQSERLLAARSEYERAPVLPGDRTRRTVVRATAWLKGSFTTTIWAALLGVLGSAAISPSLDWLGVAGLALLACGALAAVVTMEPDVDFLRSPPRSGRGQFGVAMLAQIGALVIATVALALGGWAQVMAWLALGAAAYWTGRRTSAPAMTGYGFVLLLIATGRLLTIDMLSALVTPVNDRLVFAGLELTHSTWMFVVGGAVWMWIALCEQRRQSVWREHGAPLAAMLGLVVLAAAPHLTGSEPVALGVYWAIIGIAAAWSGARSSRLVWTLCATVLLMAATAGAGLSAATMLDRFGEGAALLGLRLTWWSLGAVGIAVAWFVLAHFVSRGWRRHSERVYALESTVVATLGMACLLGSLWHPNVSHVALTLAWTALSVGVFLGHALLPRLRLDAVAALAMLASIGAWFFAFVEPDWMAIQAPAALHPGLGAAALITAVMSVQGVVLLRRDPRSKDDGSRGIGCFACCVAGMLLFTATSLEAGRVAAMVFPADPTSRAGALSIWWGVFGVGLLTLGFWRRLAWVRYAALGLIAAAAGKALLFDLASVSPGWRVASFVGLGLLMLGVGVGYLRIAAMTSKKAVEDSHQTEPNRP